MRKTLLVSLIIALAGCGGGGSNSCGVGDFNCPAGEYCKFLEGTCGAEGASGECTTIPAGCTAEMAPVCTCDNVSFFNACFAEQARQSVRSGGNCA